MVVQIASTANLPKKSRRLMKPPTEMGRCAKSIQFRPTIFEPMIGETLGPYRVMDKIGEGGMRQVYRRRAVNRERAIVACLVLTGAAATVRCGSSPTSPSSANAETLELRLTTAH